MSAKDRGEKEFQKTFNPDPEVVFLRQQLKAMEAKLHSEKVGTGEAKELVDAVRQEILISKPKKLQYTGVDEVSTSPCTHVLQLTDWHYGAVTAADEVDGFGSFGPESAEQRVLQLGNRIIEETNKKRHGHCIPNLQIIGTGDYVSGDIHPELQVTNAFPAPVQAVRCGYLMGTLLEMFAPHFENVTADLITLDNHGRLTTKPQASQGGYNNWGYVVAEVAKQYALKHKNVDIRIHAKPTALIPVGPERYLAFHGHQIRGWAGKPYYGFDRRAAMEAIKRMGVPEQSFTKMLVGHFHHGFNADVWMLGGSLSGTDAFDHSCGRFGRPHQTSWLVHPKYGEFDWTRWWLA